MTDKLKELINKCKCSVTVSVNEHRNDYISAAEYLKNHDALGGLTDDIPPEVRAKMIELETIIEVHFYPRTPVSFNKIYHHDLDAALDEALACFEGTA